MAFSLYVVYLVWLLLRPLELFDPAPDEVRVVLWLSLATLLVAFATSRAQMAERRKALFFIPAFLVAIALSLLFRWPSWIIDAFLDFMPTAATFYLTVVMIRNIDQLRTTCKVVIACAVVAAICSIIAYHTGWNADHLLTREWSGVIDEEIARDVRIAITYPAMDTRGLYLWRARGVGFLNDPNDFSQYMVMCLPLLLLVVAKGGGTVKRLLVQALPAAIMIYAIFLTKSRGAMLGLAAVVFLYLQRRFGTAWSFGGLAVLAPIALALFGGRRFTAGESSASGRIDAWAAGLKMLQSNPPFGIGYKRFTDLHELTAHNSFVLIYSEMGLLGSFLWIGLIVLAFRSVTLATRAAPPFNEWAVALRASLVGFLVCAFFLSRSYTVHLWMLLALCIVMPYVSTGGLVEPRHAAPRVRWAGTAVMLTVVSVLMTTIVVRLANAGLLSF